MFCIVVLYFHQAANLSDALVGFGVEQFSNIALSDSEAFYRSKMPVDVEVEQISNVLNRCTVKQ